MSRRYGWIPDLPDKRDYKFAPRAVTLPVSVDLKPLCPPVLDQGSLGSCTANAIAAAHQFDQKKQGFAPDWPPSRLFIYYNERAMEGTIGQDSGAYIRDGFKSLDHDGVCPENEWPYITWKFKKKPRCTCYRHARKHQAIEYRRVNQDAVSVRSALAEGFPIVFGFSVYDSFESKDVSETGVVPMPDPSENMLGGHAVMMMGYDDIVKRVTVQNSWGARWGKEGYFTMPYEYVLDDNLANDFWVVETVEND